MIARCARLWRPPRQLGRGRSGGGRLQGRASAADKESVSGSPEHHCARVEEASRYVLGDLHGHALDSYARHLLRCEACAEEVELLEHAAGSVALLVNPQAATVERRGPDRPFARLPVATGLKTEPARVVAAREVATEPAAAERGGAVAPADGVSQQAARPPLRPVPGDGAAAASLTRSGSGVSARASADGRMARERAGRSAGADARTRLRSPIPRSGLVSFIALGVLAVATLALSNTAASVRYGRIRAGWENGGAAVKLQGSHLELLVEGMPRPPRGYGYQVWVVDRLTSRPVPTTAWVRLNQLGEAGVDVPGDYHQWDAVAVYMEPLLGHDSTHSGAVVVGDLRGLSS